jgi:cobalt-zinc-cadmium efflux system outer membrane protein
VTVFSSSRAAIGAAILVQVANARAEALPCSHVTRGSVVPCALAASLSARAERHSLEAASAREDTARTILPSNPVLSGWVARRSAAGEGADVNWSATLAQEVEIGGQRGERRRAAAFGRESHADLVRVVERDAAAEALFSYFETIAAREQLRLTRDLEATAQRVSDAARGAAARGLIAGVDADVADAALVAVEDALLTRERRAREASASLAASLGLPPSTDLAVDGALEPLAVAGELAEKGGFRDVHTRPEVLALRAESRAERARADILRRERVPSPTISAFVERDGFSEQVLGVGLSFPVPLPHPLGQTFAGEIAEAEALSRAAGARAALAERDVLANSARAVAAYTAARKRALLYGPERTDRARESLRKMASEIEAGRLAVRDAVIAQEALIELLLAALAAKEDLCVASVGLARAAGVELERGVK